METGADAECACARWTSKKELVLGKRVGLRWALQRMRMRTVGLRLGGGWGGVLGKGAGSPAAALAHLPGGGEGAAAEN